ncbi:MAG: arginase family protein [Thermoleophilia bacterium]|nr:arginase family protein [Thermoleophilia bacterium]
MGELTPGDRMMVEGLYWWGPATLFRCPVDPDPAACDVALVGVPHASGNASTERDQHLGPRAVRHVSALQRRYHQAFGFSPWEACRIHDLGDVPLPELNDNEACIERITAYFRRIAEAGTRAVAIGGDHSVTGGILQGLAAPSSRLTGGRKVALFHLDAHIDAYESIPHWLGARKSAAHWASYLVRQGQVDASRSVQIGMRGNPRTADWLAPSTELGYEVIPIERYRELGPERCIELVRERAGDAPVYITFDLDCLDPSVAPAVSNLEPAFTGFTIDEATRLLRGVRGLDVIGGDVVCLLPTKDSPNQVTAMVAAAVAFELVGLVADRVAGA